MSRPKFDPEKEREIVGTYPPIKGITLPIAPDGVPETPKFWRPITPRENYKMLFEGKTPYWIPECGWVAGDTIMFRPRQQADNLAFF